VVEVVKKVLKLDGNGKIASMILEEEKKHIFHDSDNPCDF